MKKWRSKKVMTFLWSRGRTSAAPMAPVTPQHKRGPVLPKALMPKELSRSQATCALLAIQICLKKVSMKGVVTTLQR